MAGAEGFEPSARGFGVDVEKALTGIQQPVFRAPYFKGSHQVFQHLRLAGQLLLAAALRWALSALLSTTLEICSMPWAISAAPSAWRLVFQQYCR